MICSVCGSSTIRVKWDEALPCAEYCSGCDRFFMGDGDEVVEVVSPGVDRQLSIEPDIPPMEEGTRVYVNNDRHPYFLSFGVVAARDHVHYRVKFGDKLIWVPEHWVSRVPPELVRGS